MSQRDETRPDLARTDPDLAQPATRRHLLAGVRHEFVEERKALGEISPATAIWYVDMLTILQNWLYVYEGVGHLEDLTRANLVHFLGDLRERKKSADYINRHHGAARTFLRWCRRMKYQLHESLFDQDGKLTVPAPPKGKGEWLRYNLEQTEAMFKAISTKTARGTRARDLMILSTYFGSGIRLAELQGLTVDALQQDQEGHSYLHVHGKGDKWRLVPITGRLRRDLERFIHRNRAESSYHQVFLTVSGTPMAKRSIQDVIRRIAAESGVKVKSHALRHNYASAYAAKPGANLEKLRRIMGHESLETTKKYLHLTASDLASDIEDFAPL